MPRLSALDNGLTARSPTGRLGVSERRSRFSRRCSPTAGRILGPEHPDTLTVRRHLAAAYRAAGRDADAAELEAGPESGGTAR